MDYSSLEENIIAAIKEQQIKIGYSPNPVSLYYPLRSLELMVDIDETADCGKMADDTKDRTTRMRHALEGFSEVVENRLGKVGVTEKSGRFCLHFEAQAAEYVHNNIPDSPFLIDLIDTVSQHGVSMDEVLEVFGRYSDLVHIEEIDDEEFDVLVYFEDGVPDSFRYCLADEMGHVTYHRFTEAEYLDRILEI